jgi:hypothetical protein
VVEAGIYTCQCNIFEMWGLLCPHILRLMIHLNVQQIPAQYLIKRWSAAATTPAPDPGSNSFRFGVPPTNTLKYNALCRKMIDLASDACYDDETYKTVSTMVDETSKLVAAMRRARHNEQQGEGDNAAQQDNGQNSGIASNTHNENNQPAEQDAAPSSELKNPERRKNKGRPKEKSKRRKPLTKLREEAAKKRRNKRCEPKKPFEPKPKRKARTKKCAWCTEEGHSVQDCPQMKAAMAREAGRHEDVELRL